MVDKGSPRNLVSFCETGVRRIGPTQFEVRHHNWRPTRDLQVLIVQPDQFSARPVSRCAALAALTALALVSAAEANDSTAEKAAGGLVLRQARDVDMVSEDLFVSAAQVRVRYVFRNRAARPVSTIVAFPMPDRDLLYERESDTAYPADFRTLVEGRPVTMQVERKAIAHGSIRPPCSSASTSRSGPRTCTRGAGSRRSSPTCRAPSASRSPGSA